MRFGDSDAGAGGTGASGEAARGGFGPEFGGQWGDECGDGAGFVGCDETDRGVVDSIDFRRDFSVRWKSDWIWRA